MEEAGDVKILKPGVIACTCPNSWEVRQEDQVFEASLGYNPEFKVYL